MAVEMTRSGLAYTLGSEFDNFLFAPIGEDRNGMLLSVLSALARLDVDPWQEAANLAQLPKETATERLASIIAALPDGPSVYPDQGMIAARLVALLPRRASSNIESPRTFLGASAATNPWAIIYVIFMVFALGAQWLAASRQSLAQVDNVHAAASSTVAPQMQMLPPNSGQ